VTSGTVVSLRGNAPAPRLLSERETRLELATSSLEGTFMDAYDRLLELTNRAEPAL
jgi:hypothetical protein